MSSRVRPYLPIATVVLIVLAMAVVLKVNNDRSQPGPPEVIPKSTRTGGKPNVLVIMTDDQTLESMRVMANVKRWIGTPGTTFTNYFASFPNCCPSRATFFSGQFAHNSNVRDNVAPLGGNEKFNQDEALGVWMQRAGYHTTHVGKYLNGWGAAGDYSPPPGWTNWYGLIDPTTYRYYNFSVSDNGRRIDFGDDPETDYTTDVLGTEIVNTIKERASGDEPWFISWAPLAPHAQEGERSGGDNESEKTDVIENIRATLPVPADKHKGKMAKESLPKPPSFNFDSDPTKPAWVQKRLPIGFNGQGLIREGYIRELESLLSVDEWVGKIFNTLEKSNQLANTVVIYTSDNGFYHGEHQLTFSKVYLYEPGVHLPMLVRGGPFPKGKDVAAVSGNVDLATTIMGLGGATSPLVRDGRNLATVAVDPAKGDGRGMLLENWTDYGNAHTWGIRTDRWKYLNNERLEEELYDLEADPHELRNLANDPSHAATKAELKARAERLAACKGATCEGADAAVG